MDVNSDVGLTDEQVKESATKHCRNVLTRAKPESLLEHLWKSATEPMILMLIMAGLIALSINIIRAVTGSEADFLENVGIFTAISISIIITVAMEGKSAKAFEALNKINENIMVKAIRNGNPIILNQKDLVVNDVLIVSTGDKIPADCRLLESRGLTVDESTLTGKSIPVEKDAKYILPNEKTPIAERRNMLYAGTYITDGFGKLLVTAVGDKTEFGKIAHGLTNNKKPQHPCRNGLVVWVKNYHLWCDCCLGGICLPTCLFCFPRWVSVR
jgi:Ca2+-transporting ATPase